MEGTAFPNRIRKQKPSPGQKMLPASLGVLFLVITALSLQEEDMVADGDSSMVGIV